MKWSVITLFPELFEAFSRESLIGRAFQDGAASLDLVNLRDFGIGKHRQVDDTVYGGGTIDGSGLGGDGMLLMCEPLFAAFRSLESKEEKKEKKRRIFLTPQGERLTQRKVEELASLDEVVLLCGRYEGVDQRVRDEWIDEEISLGDFVLTGGELPAMVLMDAVIRLLPGVLGKDGSHQMDSFSEAFEGKKEYPQYTKPAEFEGLKVPDVLLSGNHAAIEQWRREHLKD